jgi:hypothetical protein
MILMLWIFFADIILSYQESISSISRWYLHCLFEHCVSSEDGVDSGGSGGRRDFSRADVESPISS